MNIRFLYVKKRFEKQRDRLEINSSNNFIEQNTRWSQNGRSHNITAKRTIGTLRRNTKSVRFPLLRGKTICDIHMYITYTIYDLTISWPYANAGPVNTAGMIIVFTWRRGWGDRRYYTTRRVVCFVQVHPKLLFRVIPDNIITACPSHLSLC